MTTTATKNIHETSELIEEDRFNIISQNFTRMPNSREWFSSRNVRDRHTYMGLLWVITAWIKSPDSRIQTDSSETDSRYFTNDHVNSWLWQPQKKWTVNKNMNSWHLQTKIRWLNREELQQQAMMLNKEEIWQRYQTVQTITWYIFYHQFSPPVSQNFFMATFLLFCATNTKHTQAPHMHWPHWRGNNAEKEQKTHKRVLQQLQNVVEINVVVRINVMQSRCTVSPSV